MRNFNHEPTKIQEIIAVSLLNYWTRLFLKIDCSKSYHRQHENNYALQVRHALDSADDTAGRNFLLPCISSKPKRRRRRRKTLKLYHPHPKTGSGRTDRRIDQLQLQIEGGGGEEGEREQSINRLPRARILRQRFTNRATWFLCPRRTCQEHDGVDPVHTYGKLALSLSLSLLPLPSSIANHRPHTALEADPYSIIWMHAIQRRTAN